MPSLAAIVDKKLCRIRGFACHIATVWVLLLLVASQVSSVSQGESTGPAEATPTDTAGSVTFTRDIAPIVYRHCVSCHRPGESAPFSLIRYRDIKKRARQVVEVTETRFMPPWLPEPGHGEFRGERRLTDADIQLIRRWVEEGILEGAAADLPPAPKFIEGWMLGEPDLVVAMPEPYTLPPQKTDVFRNFVIAASLTSKRYVQTVDMRPGSALVIHHAELKVDPTRESRMLDGEDDEPGFEGMVMSLESRNPGGRFVSWTPGKVPFTGRPDMAWPLEPGSDLVLQLHMLPSGKPEVIRSSIGFYFTDTPPTRLPINLRLGSKVIDIAPGEENYAMNDTFVLPIDVELVSIYPHAHYLARDMQCRATLPDGTTHWLIRIKDWDFNWQDEYHYRHPILLPRGTRIWMQYTYDNSSGNKRNPNQPPRRILWGPQTSDEMGDLWLQVLPRNHEEAAVLQQAYRKKEFAATVAGLEYAVRVKPDDDDLHYNLGILYVTAGRTIQAREAFERALALNSGSASAHYQLSSLLTQRDELDRAVAHLNDAVRIDPEFSEAQNNLGHLYLKMGNRSQAVRHFQLALTTRPTFADAHYNLGLVYSQQGELGKAARHYQKALDQKPDYAEAHNNLGVLRAGTGDIERAVHHLELAIASKPEFAEAHTNLGGVLATAGKWEEAELQYRQALRLAPEDVGIRYKTGTVLESQGKLGEAIEFYREVLHRNPAFLRAANDLAWILATASDPRIRDGKVAVRWAEKCAAAMGNEVPEVLDTLAAAYAEAGQYPQAVSMAGKAIKLARANHQDQLANQMEKRLRIYTAGRPYHVRVPESAANSLQ